MAADGARNSLCRQAYAVVLAGGRGRRLGPLTDHRAKPAMPFAGQLSIIDFALSNCVHAGIRRIAVLTQYKAQSLIRHLERGWGFLAGELGEGIDVVPAQQQCGDGWYAGTADAVWQNADLIREAAPRHVLVLGGDQVYKMDPGQMLADHVASGLPASVACVEVAIEDASAFGVIAVDAADRVVAFEEKPARPQALPGRPGRALASMGIYVFDTDVLLAALSRDAAETGSCHDFGCDLIPALLRRMPLHAHRFESSCVREADQRPYWRDVGTVDAYWAANMDLLEQRPELDLDDADWPILGRTPQQLPPARFVGDAVHSRGVALDSLVAAGCVVLGATVRRSILFTGVRLAERTVVEQSLLLPGVLAGRGVRLRRTVVDARCRLPDGFEAGFDAAADRARGLHVSDGGITVVTPAMLAQPPTAGLGG